MTLRVWNCLRRRTPLQPGKPPKRTAMLRSTKPIPKSNPARQARHDAEYRRKLAAYRRSETYKIVAERAGGRCEYTWEHVGWTGDRTMRCPATDKLHHHHRRYGRQFGGNERPEDMLVVCEFCHALLESAHPTRRHGRVAG